MAPGDYSVCSEKGHPALAYAFDVSQLWILFLDVMHDLGPLGIGIIPLPAYRKVQLTMVTTRALLEFFLGINRRYKTGQNENGQRHCRDVFYKVFLIHRAPPSSIESSLTLVPPFCDVKTILSGEFPSTATSHLTVRFGPVWLT